MLSYRSALVTAPTATATEVCPASTPVLISGGYSGVAGVGATQPATASFPSGAPTPNAWTVVLAAAPTANWAIYAVCSK